MRVVLVTGAAGGVGRALLALLREQDWRVRCLVHRRAVDGADETVEGDLDDAASLERATQGAHAVLHLAARTHARRPRDYVTANVDGTRRLLDAARAAGVKRFVYVSTRAIDPSGGAYSGSKRAGELLVKASGLEWTVVRLPEVYGANAGEGVDLIIAKAHRGAPIPVVGRGSDVVCPIHLDDATGPLAAALEAAPAAHKVYTLAGECMTMREFAQTCVATMGGSSRIVGVPRAALRALSLIAYVAPAPLYPDQLARLSSVKPPASPDAVGDLGFSPRPLREGLADIA